MTQFPTHWEVRYYAPMDPWKQRVKEIKGGVRAWRAQFKSLQECKEFMANNELDTPVIWKDGERYVET